MNDESTNVGKLSNNDIKSLLQCSENEFATYLDEINRPKLESVEAINYRDSLLNCVKESRKLYKNFEKTFQLMQQKFLRQSQAIASAADTKIKTETEIIQKVLTEKFAKKSQEFELETLKSKEALERQALIETQRAKSSIQNCKLLIEDRHNNIKSLLLRNNILYNLSRYPIDSTLISKQIYSDSNLLKLDSDIGFTRLLERKREYTNSSLYKSFDSTIDHLQDNFNLNRNTFNQIDRVKSSLNSGDYKSVLFDLERLPEQNKRLIYNSEFGDSLKYFCLFDLTLRYFTAHLTATGIPDSI